MGDISQLVGRILIRVDGGVGDDSLVFHCLDGAAFRMYHSQDCCESVSLDDVCGDMLDMHGLVTEAYESSSEGEGPQSEHDEDFEWTFYVISTQRGAVTFRWYGTSNGYYSTSVYFERVN